MFKQFEEAVTWITSLTAFGVRPGLTRIQTMMERMGHPERRLKFIHVAGTNGKGSTCTMISSCLLAAGYNVATYTSPYLEKYTNRIQYNGNDIPEASLLRIVNELYPIVEELAQGTDGSPTMFEVTTAIALVYFAKEAVPDFVVWETGLGGKLDVTNIVLPIVSVITNIGKDHEDVLGNTIAGITAEKAGIIKAGVPVISAATQPEAIEVLAETARTSRATLYLLDRNYRFERIYMDEKEQVFNFYSPFSKYEAVKLSMTGQHQANNAAAALMTLEILRQYQAVIIEEEDIRNALAAIRWPGRLEIISDQPKLLLDGAHNPEGAEMLVKSIKHIYPNQKKHFMIGMLRSKNHRTYLEHILRIADTLVITEPDFRGPMNGAEFLQIANEIKHELQSDATILIKHDWKQAAAKLREMVQTDAVGIIAGSLYLISDVRSWLLYQTESDKGW